MPPEKDRASTMPFSDASRSARAKPKPLAWKQWSAENPAHWKIPFLLFEWICENISYHLGRWAFIEVLEYVGKLSVLGAIILFIWDIPQRRQAAEDARKAKHYIAWQTLNSAVGKTGNGGRTDALQDLHRDGLSLAGVDLSGGDFPVAVVLTGADMKEANIVGAYFNKPRFAKVKLSSARIERTNFFYGDFRGADLSETSLSNLKFYGCDFSSATISPTECRDVEFTYCDFHGAQIYMGTETTSFTDTTSAKHKASFINTAFKNCSFTNCLLNIPEDQLTPETFVSCNLFKIESGYINFESYAAKDHRNASVPKVSFLEWLTWLGQNRRNLAEYNPNYDVFYQADDERVRREWPTAK